MKIIVTGGAGFVGSNLAIFLKERISNCEVVCLDNLKRRGSELNLPLLYGRDIKFLHCDIRSPEDMMEIKSADYIIDASAEPSVQAGIDTPATQLINTNLIGTINLLELAQQTKARFIFLSTSRVYSVEALNKVNYEEEETRFTISSNQPVDGVSELGINEAFSTTGSRSFYGTSKLASELFIQEYAVFKGLQAVVNRCGIIAGPGQLGKVDQGVMTLWVARHVWKKELVYFGFGGAGKQVRDILHIDDLSKLVLLQVQNFSKVKGQLFNVGGGLKNTISLSELTLVCQDVTGNKIPVTSNLEERKADIRTYVTDNSKIMEKMAWTPSKTVRKNVEDIFAWILANESSLKPILNS